MGPPNSQTRSETTPRIHSDAGMNAGREARRSAGSDGSSHEGRSRRGGDFVIYFANVTSWNSASVQYLADSSQAMGKAHVVAVVETHLKGHRLIQEAKAFHKLGWRATMVEAVPTPGALRDGPGHGGVAVMARTGH